MAAEAVPLTARVGQVGVDGRLLPRGARRDEGEAAASGSAAASVIHVGGRHRVLIQQQRLTEVADVLIGRAVVAHRRAGDRLREVVAEVQGGRQPTQELRLAHTQHVGGRGRVGRHQRRRREGGGRVHGVQSRDGIQRRRGVALSVVHTRCAIIARTHHHCHTQRRQLLQCRLRRSLVARPIVPLRVPERVRVAHHLRPHSQVQRRYRQQRRDQRRRRARQRIEAVCASRVGLHERLYVQAGLVGGVVAEYGNIVLQVDRVVIVVCGGGHRVAEAGSELEVVQVERREGLVVQLIVDAVHREAADHCSVGALVCGAVVALVVVVGGGQRGGRQGRHVGAASVGCALHVGLLRLHCVHHVGRVRRRRGSG